MPAASFNESPFVTLYLDIAKHETPSLATVGAILSSFDQFAKGITETVDPFTEHEIEFDGTETGSLRILTKLKSNLSVNALTRLERILIVALLLQPITGIVTEDFWRNMLERVGYPPQQLSSEDIQKIADSVATAMKQPSVRQARDTIYTKSASDEAIKGIGALPDRAKEKPRLIIPRKDFQAMLMGETESPEIDPKTRTIPHETTLILESATLRIKSKAQWHFRWNGHVVKARVEDTEFLQKTLSGEAKIPLVEGLQLEATLVDHQVFRNGVWEHDHFTVKMIKTWNMPEDDQASISFPDPSE